MDTIKTYTKDLQIAKALIRRNEAVTRKYFYKQCYPLFKSIYDNYYTDCDSCLEFINEIYIIVLAPSRKTGKCQMENYRGESTLTRWLKTACLYYCYSKFEVRGRIPRHEQFPTSAEEKDAPGDRIDEVFGSNEIDFDKLNREDAICILNLMPNKRYRNLIELRYLEQKTNEETAEALGMTMDNYYNKHKLAKDQYLRVLRKEEHHE